jgi:hypothetical protein
MIELENETKPWTGGTHTVELPDGHSAVMRNMTGRDMIALAGDDFGDALTRLSAAVVSHDYEGDLFDQEYDLVIQPLLIGWKTGSRESAVPPQNGQR